MDDDMAAKGKNLASKMFSEILAQNLRQERVLPKNQPATFLGQIIVGRYVHDKEDIRLNGDEVPDEDDGE